MEDNFIIDSINEISGYEDKITKAKLKIEEEENALYEKLQDIERDKYDN